MGNRLVRIGAQGFNFQAVVGWQVRTHPELPNERVICLFLSGVSEPMLFEAESADLVQKLLTSCSQNLTPTPPGV